MVSALLRPAVSSVALSTLNRFSKLKLFKEHSRSDRDCSDYFYKESHFGTFLLPTLQQKTPHVSCIFQLLQSLLLSGQSRWLWEGAVLGWLHWFLGINSTHLHGLLSFTQKQINPAVMRCVSSVCRDVLIDVFHSYGNKKDNSAVLSHCTVISVVDVPERLPHCTESKLLFPAF